jgi:hypothetical protein|tara:strand:- start:202 stop:615 length:414 start_codon:yes stop_codon:yes gene_type:complete
MGRVFFNTRENIDSEACAGTTTYVMKASDSGKTFLVSGGTQAITLLPAADLIKGWNCKFITTASPSGDKTIGAGSTIIHGATANSDTAAVASSDGTAKTNVIIEAASQAGNVLEIVCDGSLYHATGIQGQNAAFSFS